MTEAWKVLAFDLNPELGDEVTQNYERNTRAAIRNDFNPDPRECSNFFRFGAKLLNDKNFSDLFNCHNIAQGKKTC